MRIESILLLLGCLATSTKASSAFDKIFEDLSNMLNWDGEPKTEEEKRIYYDAIREGTGTDQPQDPIPPPNHRPYEPHQNRSIEDSLLRNRARERVRRHRELEAKRRH